LSYLCKINISYLILDVKKQIDSITVLNNNIYFSIDKYKLYKYNNLSKDVKIFDENNKLHINKLYKFDDNNIIISYSIVRGYKTRNYIALLDCKDNSISPFKFHEESHEEKIEYISKINNEFLVTGDDDGYVCLWNFTEKSFIKKIRPCDQMYDLINFNDDLIAIATDNYILIYNIKNEIKEKIFYGIHGRKIFKLIKFDKKYIISAGYDGKITLTDITSDPNNPYVFALYISKNNFVRDINKIGNFIVITRLDFVIQFLNIPSTDNFIYYTFDSKNTKITSIMDFNGTQFLTGDKYGKLKLWDLNMNIKKN
jgi:WD40 repeat protein